jgi:hypothetical protein
LLLLRSCSRVRLAVTDVAEATSPHLLWRQANAEHPDDWHARRARYTALMIEHGHLIVKPEPLETRTRETES